MEFSGKKVTVVGTGISGIGAVGLLNAVGAEVVLYDGNEKLKIEDIEKKLGTYKAEIVLGELTKELTDSSDLLVISPGVPIDSPVVKAFEAAGVPVWGEVELAYAFDKGKVLAITGTNGKTTTTALVGQIVGAYHKDTFVVGNIGNPYTTEVLKSNKDSYTVAEISSFQLKPCMNSTRFECHFKYYAGSFKPPLYDGLLCADKGKDCDEPEGVRGVRTEF